MKSVKKFVVFFSIFSLLSSLIFAAPGGDSGRGGDKDRSRPSGRPTPRERTAPNASRPVPRERTVPETNRSVPKERTALSANRNSDSPSKSSSDKDHAKPGESIRNQKDNTQQNQAPNDFPQGSNAAPPPESAQIQGFIEPKPIDSISGNEQNPQTSPEIIFYRGTRTLSDGEIFTLQNIKSERNENGEILLEITFNQSVNPRTFNQDSILVNGEKISSKIKFTFNKKGDTIKLTVPAKSETISLSIQNVESFDGTKIEPTQINIKN